MQTVESILTRIKEQQIEMVDMKFIDLYGSWHHITLPVSHVNEKTFRYGIPFDGSSVPGFKTVEAGDMVLLPDPQTAQIDPFMELPTLSLIGSVAEADTRELFYRDPRCVAQRAEEYLKKTGIADESRWGPEFEFYVFDSIDYIDTIKASGYFIDSEEGEWNTYHEKGPNKGHRLAIKGGYHALPPADTLHDLRSQMVKILEETGVPVNYHHHEVGGPGQCEIEVILDTLKKMGDMAMWAKYVIRMTAHQANKTATFMPKPLFGVPGSGMHFHQHLFKEGQPLFYEKGNYADLSKTAQYYCGGLLKHGAALLGLTNPSTNSYKRLIPGYEAPVNAFYSLANRSAAIRIIKYATLPETKRIEFRPPDATGNIYLSMAAQLMAGIDGIINKIDPSEHGFGPYDMNIFELSEEERKGIKPLPTNLKEALQALRDDHEFLLQGDVFSKDLLETWIDRKLQEDRQVHNRPHPYEMNLYYEA